MNDMAFMKVDKAAFYKFAQEHDEQRFEYEDGYIVQQMTGGTRAHAHLALKMVLLLSAQLDADRWIALPERGVDCQQAVRYPDIVVEPTSEPPESLSTQRPALIVEILSPSSASLDLKRKPTEYLAIDTLQAYVVLSQFSMAAQLWTRDPTGQLPTEPLVLTSPEATITVDSLSIHLTLAEIYSGIQLPKQD